MIRAAIVGGSGYIGGELLRLLSSHPHVEGVACTSRRVAGRRAGRGPRGPRAGAAPARGADLRRLLASHPHVEVVACPSRRLAGRRVDGAHPNLRGSTEL